MEVEEMVVATPTISTDDYIQCRIFHLLLTIFHYEANYEEAFEFAKSRGLSVFDLVTALHQRLDQAPQAFRQVVDDFVRESDEELFLTAEECEAWAIANYDKLVDGTLGGNLLSKYSMIGRFYATSEGLDFLEATIRAIGEERGWSWGDGELEAVIGYLRVVLLQVPFADSLDARPVWSTRFDVEQWRNEGYEGSLSAHCFEEVRTFQTTVEPDRRQELQTKIGTFGEHPSGLGKFTRTMFARDIRRTIV